LPSIPFSPPAGPFFTLSRIQFSWLSLLFTLVQFSPHFHQKFFGSPVTNSSEVSHSQGQFSGEKVIPWLGKKQYRTHTPGGIVPGNHLAGSQNEINLPLIKVML